MRRVNARVPRDLETICMAALARDPNHRYQSAAALRDDLRRFLDREAIHRQPPTLVARALRTASRYRRVLTTAAVLAVGTVRKQPVVRDDQITIAQVMKATLSTDHRVADGAQAAQFLVEIKRVLESPVNLLV